MDSDLDKLITWLRNFEYLVWFIAVFWAIYYYKVWNKIKGN